MMDAKFDFNEIAKDAVYVKPIATADLPDDVREKVGELEQLFAVHDADGKRLALVANRKLAFALARQNDMQPMVLQ